MIEGRYKMKTIYFLLGCALVLGGCMSVGPDFKAKALPDPDCSDLLNSGTDGSGRSGAIDGAALSGWWTCLNDPVLSQLMDEAFAQNLDLREARAKVLEARSQLVIDRADGWPELSARGDYTRQRTSANTAAGQTGGDLVTGTYSAGFDASWEIDIWGGTRRAVEAAEADVKSQEASLASVKVSLAAELAKAYVKVRTCQEQIRVTKKNIRAQADTLEMLESKLAAGLSDELSVSQARYNLEDTKSALPQIYTDLESSINSIAVLTGQIPGSLHQRLSPKQPVPMPPFDIVTQIPGNTLRQRPDVQKAEYDLAAQTARIGQATADLYPSFSLTGAFGLSSLSSATFFDSDSRTWSLVPGLTLPIFNAGSIRANIRIQEARQEQLLAQYEGTVLSAIEEIRNALTAYAREQQRQKALGSAVAAAKDAVAISQDKYRNGLVDFDNVLDAQRSLCLFENSLADAKGTVTRNFIALYKAFGGGWAWGDAQ